VIFRFWEGLSSMGGVLGALIGLFAYFRKAKVPLNPYLDALAMGVAPGWAIARIGCFLVHDHPGTRTDFPLAVDFPVVPFGGPRHDLGLYDFLVLTCITGIVWGLSRLKPREGRLMGVLAVTYSPCRFALDFLRASDLSFVDRRYAGLTPAQYVVSVLFCVGVWLLVRKAPEVTLKPPKPVKASGGKTAKAGR
jgi:phosphatidylglycerol:prolipoprotein diacylglycerol transferase